MSWVVSLGDMKVELEALSTHRHVDALNRYTWTFEVEGETHVLSLLPNETGLELWWRGQMYPVTVEPKHIHTFRQHFKVKQQGVADGHAVTAHMPGLVTQVNVEVGQDVKRGEGVVVLEAMKMENELRAPDSGVIENVQVEVGQQVNKGQLLCVIRPSDEA